MQPSLSASSNQLLADKYRPQTLRAFQLDASIQGALNSLIVMNNLNVLLYGNPSCGKTTLIEVLVREYYGTNSGANGHPTQVMHINSLREQGVRFYRTEMKAFCRSVSIIPGKKKLVIIDDIDGVPEQSQQVFRDYLDRYHDNVCFIAACTNLQRVIESIQSRVNILCIRPLPAIQIGTLLNHICLNESITITDDISTGLCKGSVKAAINGLEKARLLSLDSDAPLDVYYDNINVHFNAYITHLQTKNLTVAIQTLFTLYDTGYSVIDILDFFYQYVKTTNQLDELVKYAMVPIICDYIHIFYNLHEAQIELALFTNELMGCLKLTTKYK